MWILVKFGFALMWGVSRALGWEFLRIDLQAGPNSLQYAVKRKSKKRHESPKQAIYLPFNGKLVFDLVPERRLFGFLRWIGFCDEIQTGDHEFDSRFYIASDSPRFVQAIRDNQRFRAILMSLSEAGFLSISSRARGYLVLEYPGTEFEMTEDRAAKLGALVRSIDEMCLTAEEHDPYRTRLQVFEGVLFAMVGYALAAILTERVSFSASSVNWSALRVPTIGIGLGLLTISFGLAWLGLRNSSRSALVVAEMGFFALIGVPLAALFLTMDLNRLLDSSQSVTFVGQLTTLDTSKRNCCCSVEVKEQTSSQRVYPVSIPCSIIRGTPSGSWVRLFYRSGFFGAQYLDQAEPTAAP